MTRRAFVGAGVALGSVAMAPSAWTAGSAATAAALHPAAAFHRSRFTPLVGERLRLTGDGLRVRVVLSEVSDLLPMRRADDPDRFSLLFTAPAGAPRISGIHTLHHRTLGRLALFVSSVDRGLQDTRYEAIVDRSHA